MSTEDYTIDIKPDEIVIHHGRNILCFSPEEAANILELLQANKTAIKKTAKLSAEKGPYTPTLPILAYQIKMVVGEDIFFHNHVYCKPRLDNKNYVELNKNNQQLLDEKTCFYCGAYLSHMP